MNASTSAWTLAILLFTPGEIDTTSEDTAIVYKAEAQSDVNKTKLVYEVGEPVIVRVGIEVPTGKHFIRWKVRGDVDYETFEGKTVLVIGWDPGEYEAEFLLVDFEKSTILEEEFLVVVQGSRPPPVEPVEPDTTDTTKAVVVYESSGQPVAPHATSARDKIEEAGIEYRIVDQHVETGTGETPKDVALAIEAAQAEGATFPVLVLLSKDKATKVIPLPLTAEEIVSEVVK